MPDPPGERTSPRTMVEAAAWWAGGLLAALVHAGLWATPNLENFAAAAAGFPGSGGVSGPGDYILSGRSVLGFARLIGWTEPHEYARLSLVAVVIGSAVLVWLGWRRGGLSLARGVAVVVAASPLATVSLQWLGQPDPVTGGCALAAVLVRSRWTVAALGVIAGLTHPEQAIGAFIAVAAVRWAWPAEEPPGDAVADTRRPDIVAAVGGVVTGVVLGRLSAAAAGITVSRSRLEYVDFGLANFIEHHRVEPAALAWNLLGTLWIMVGALAVLGLIRRSSDRDRGVAPDPNLVHEPSVPADRAARRRLARVTGAVAVAALVPVLFTLDETRVYAVLTAPALAALAWFTAALSNRTARLLGAGLLVLTAAIPGGFTTGAAAWRSDFDSVAMAQFLLDGSRPPDAPPLTFWLLAPLDLTIPELPRG